MDAIEIKTYDRITGTVRPPGSKSITNRSLICAALAGGDTTLTGVLDSVDTRVMVKALQTLGISIAEEWNTSRLTVHGCAGAIPNSNVELYLENSGTSIRFLTALCSLGKGRFVLDGNSRMRERPIQDLLDALTEMGASCVSMEGNACPPVELRCPETGNGLRGGEIPIRGNLSSQYLSAIMMVAPYAQSDVHLRIQGELVSKPYVTMTAEVMASFGGHSDHVADDHLIVPAGQSYSGRSYDIEPDASAASYFWGAAAITGGDVTVEGLSRNALQGDVRFCECLEAMGCKVEYLKDSIRVSGRAAKAIEVDMGDISDTVQTLAAVALFADGKTTVRGVAHNRHKETDRISDLACELRKLGAEVEEFEDGLSIQPRALTGAKIETYDDHRMAMSLSLVGLKVPGVIILDPGCTSKTYPHFFEDMETLATQGKVEQVR